MTRAAAVLLALAAGCRPPEQPRPAGGPARKPAVSVETVALGEIEYVIQATGSVEAAEEISLPARVSGLVEALHFKEGDAVTESSVLLEIEPDKYRLGEERAKAEHDRARAQATLAETVFRNRQALHEEGLKQKKEWVTAEQMAGWRADLEKAKADVERARIDLELAARSRRDSRVQPPRAGLVNRKLVSRGEYVKPETVVATMLNVSTLHLRFTVPELEASRLSPGQEVRFAVRSAGPGRPFRARLFHLSQKADPSTRAVECKAEVMETGEGLRAGVFASVTILTGKQKALLVPERAVLHSERGFLLIVAEGGKAWRRSVDLGMRVGSRVEVTKNLREGETIVVDGAAAASLRDGLELEIVPSPEAKP